MPPYVTPSRRSSQSEGWVMVVADFADGAHTPSRSPQLNGDNVSSGQVADAMSGGTPVRSLSEPSTPAYDAHPGDVVGVAHNSRRPESNSSSTETPGTDNTMTALDAATTMMTTTTMTMTIHQPQPHDAQTFHHHHHHHHLGAATLPPLTQSNMELHQRGLEQDYFHHLHHNRHHYHTGNIYSWVADAGTGWRLAGRSVSSVGGGGGGGGGGRSMSNTASSSVAGSHDPLDWQLVPPPHPLDDDQIAAAGAWCDPE